MLVSVQKKVVTQCNIQYDSKKNPNKLFAGADSERGRCWGTFSEDRDGHALFPSRAGRQDVEEPSASPFSAGETLHRVSIALSTRQAHDRTLWTQNIKVPSAENAQVSKILTLTRLG